MAGDKTTDAPAKPTAPDASEALAKQALSHPSAKSSETSTLDTIHAAAAYVATATDKAVDVVGRLGVVSEKAVVSTDLAAGVWHAVKYDVTHPVQTATMIGESAVVGGVLKTVVSSRSPLGAAAGLGVGLYFGWTSTGEVRSAYGQALGAKTDKDLDVAAKNLGDAGGAFAVNTAIGWGSYKAGAGVAGRLLESESADAFVVGRERAWDAAPGKAMEAVKWAAKLPGRLVAGSDAEATAAAPVPLGDTFAIKAGSANAKIRMVGDRAELLNTAKAAPLGTAKGEIAADTKVSITLMAQTKGSPLLMDRYVNRITNRGAAPLTAAEITEKFGTTDASKAAITKFAADHNLTITDTNHASGRFFVEGTAENMQKAFGVKWQEYEHNGVTFRGREGSLSVSPEVAPHIKAVLGLDNRPSYHTNYRVLNDAAGMPAADSRLTPTQTTSTLDKLANLNKQTAVGKLPADAPPAVPEGTDAKVAAPEAAAAAPKPRALSVADVFKAYGKPGQYLGKGMVTGFLSLGGTMPEGWNDYLTSKGIDPAKFKTVNVGSEAPTPDPKGSNGENALDGVIHKEALPEATTVMIQAPNDDSGMPNGEDQITHASVSWGQYEDGWTTQARAAMTDAGKRAALKGVTITVAAGDNGAGDGSPSHIQQVDDPAGTGAYTSVGGTMLLVNKDGSYNSEKTWSGMGATGGGRSMFSLRGAWTSFLKTIPGNLNGSKFDGTPVPDIGLNGDPRSGWLTFTDQGVVPIGGTSAGAPGTAVIAAIVSEATGKKTGFWSPQLWAFGRDGVDVYNDITVGNNTDEGVKGYPATKGYDLNTGWGTIKIGNMVDAYNNLGKGSATAKTWAGTKDVFRQSSGTQVPYWLIPSQNLTAQQLANQQQLETAKAK
jgi:kumamolisin